MVQQTAENSMPQKLTVSGTATAASQSQPLLPDKKVALREIPNDSNNIISKPNEPPTLSNKDKLTTPADAIKLLGTKRPNPNSPTSPLTYTGSTNGHLVYVRRKLESEQGSKLSTSTSPNGKDEPAIKEQTLVKTESNSNASNKRGPLTVSQDWKDRFMNLQLFLKNCDQSGQEEYIRMLRNLSAVGRSKHAVELEKRAIHLLLEEGKELHRMKALNVLGKSSPSDLYSPQAPSPLQPHFQR